MVRRLPDARWLMRSSWLMALLYAARSSKEVNIWRA